MSMKLRELIRSVRSAKTAAEERAVITKESALIRTAFKDQHQMNGTLRHRNVAKILFIHMLGYPSHFGQMETLKLISAGNFAGKRVGYLALMVLLDEMSEILTLVTNSMQNDLRHKNQFVVGLALSAAGNIGSHEMMRNLAPEIDKHLRSQNPFIRKKAAICALRLVQKVPELAEDFCERILALLNDRNHAVLLNGVTLVLYLLRNEPDLVGNFKTMSLVKKMVRRLTGLVRSGYQPEYDISGITDPFLQVSILKLMRFLGKGDAELSEAMSDILAQVATNTEANKNTGIAILYECVLTIMNIESESGLRVLAVNLLGRFLLNTDNNIRYVALNTLCQVVDKDITAVSRHRNTVVDCLKDPDVSIRHRAMELIYSLVNATNIKALAREMLNYLVVAEPEQKADLCSRISQVVRKFAPSPRWHIDTLLMMLSIAGQHVQESVVSQTLRLVSNNEKLQPYVAHKLFGMLQEDLSQEALARVGVWCIGEYAEHLLEASEDTGEEVSESDVIDIIEKSMKAYFSTDKMKTMAITALAKLSTRFTSHDSLEKVRKLVSSYKQSMRLELQQRSTEFSIILGDDWEDLRGDLLKVMPAFAEKDDEEEVGNGDDDEEGGSKIVDEDDDDDDDNDTGNGDDDLLAGLFGGDTGTSDSNGVKSAPKRKQSDDLLSDLFSGSSGGGAGGNETTSSSGGDGGDLMGDLFASSDSSSPAVVGYPSLVAFDQDGIKLTLSFTKTSAAGETDVMFTSTNSNSYDVTNFVVHAAFPKYIKHEWKSTSGNALAANGAGAVTQGLKLTNTMVGRKQVLMKLKIEYSGEYGGSTTRMAKVGGFPKEM
eukprot:g1159.t1